MNTHIITIFDKNYVGRALAFRDSLYIQDPERHVHLLCLDEEAFELVTAQKLEYTTIMRVSDLSDKELETSRATRTSAEFASTVKPAFLLHMMKSGIVSRNDLLVFIDPDFYFYDSPTAIFKKMYDSGSIIITSHRFPKRTEQDRFKKGTYNAGIIGFRNDTEALACLVEWRKQCIEWCYLRYEDGKIGDQGYLTDWPKKYRNVFELPDIGVNLSTWNIENYIIKISDPGHFLIDGQSLICYHFHGIRLYLNKHGHIRALPVTIYHRAIYRHYIQALDLAYQKLQRSRPGWSLGTVPNPGLLRLLKQKLQEILR